MRRSLALGLGLGLGLGLVTGCAPERTADKPRAAPPSAQLELSGVHLTDTRDGERVWELSAERVAYRAEAGLAELTNVRATFYEGGAIASTLSAPRGTAEQQAGRLRLDGGVKVAAADRKAGFEAARVAWGERPDALSAEGGVRFWRANGSLAAARLSADRALKHVTLDGSVTGRASLGTVLPLFPSNPAGR